MTKPQNWTLNEWKTFIAFATTSNKDIPHHPLDYRKWNEFVITSFGEKSKVSASEVKTAMIDAGWSEDKATTFFDKFEEDRDLLTQFKESNKFQ